MVKSIRETWSIPEAVFVGIGGSLTFAGLLHLSSALIERHGYAFFTRFQIRELTVLIAELGTGVVLAPVLLSISKRRAHQQWWAAIEWNSTDLRVAPAIACGAIFALLVSVCLKALFGTAGSLRGPVTLLLYLCSEVFVASFFEEIYFRGILFIALANTMGAVTSIVIVTLVSSLVHLGHMLYVLPVMALIGFMRIRTRSVAYCFILHASYNFFLGAYLLIAGR